MQPSLYESVMGGRFARLDAAVQAFHSLSGARRLQGLVEIRAPDGWVARCFARLLGTPLVAQSGALCFELTALPGREIWVRHFPAHVTRSSLVLEEDCLVERLGAATLFFTLAERDGRLSMRLVRMKFLGLPCPRRLLPVVQAEEWGAARQLHFDVSAHLPNGALVAGYRGQLDLAQLPGAAT